MPDQRVESESASDTESPDIQHDLRVVEAPETQPRDDEPPPPKKRRRFSQTWLRRALFALLPLVLAIGIYWYVTGGQVMSTTNAYVNAKSVGVTTDVAGIVKEVDVTDHQHVAKGQVLYRLDPEPFQIAVDQAEANLAQVELTLNSMKQDYNAAASNVSAQQAQLNLAQINYDRAAMLLRTGAGTRQAYDQANSTLQAAKAQVQSLQHQAAVQLARLGGNASTPTKELPQYRQALAQLAEAQRQLRRSVVKAPFSGTVTNVPSTSPGRYLASATPAFFLVDTDHLWIDANPKETELTWVRPGQPATITVDTYPGLKWHGRVESISPASAQQFSLLPAQNTTGNWVKVVQRIPMRVSVDTTDQKLPMLRAGMSTEVSVDTGHARGLPHFLTGWF
jgi:membrane fusion protein (multidrug efflux system)